MSGGCLVRNRVLRRGEGLLVFCTPQKDFSGVASNRQRGEDWCGGRVG